MHKLAYKLIFVIILAVFWAGIMELFFLRFQRGDVYPAYSSLRSDPLGTKVLFKSLGNFSNFSVNRNYQSLARLEGNSNSVLLYLGAGSEDFEFREEKFFQSLDQYVIQGGRLIISFLPVQRRDVHDKPLPVKQDKKFKPSLEKKETTDDQEHRDFVSLEKHWGIVLTYEDSKKGNVLTAKGKHLPASLTWHSTMSLHCLNDSWHTLYTVKQKPVMVEKSLGRGSIVLMTDSYIFSNEALLRDRQLSLLSALFQGRKEIIFDEYHLGVISQHGIIDLMVKYRLHFFLFVLFLIFILLVWKNSSLSTGHLQNNLQASLIESKKDYFEGLVSLLRKNIAPKDVLRVCIEEWKRGIKKDQEVKKYMDAALLSSKDQGGDPARGYQLIYNGIKRKDKV